MKTKMKLKLEIITKTKTTVWKSHWVRQYY